MWAIIRLEGLPLSANAKDIRNFFHGLDIPPGGVRIFGGEKSNSFIAFSTEKEARKAMLLTNKLLNGVPVQLFLSSAVEMRRELNQIKDRSVAASVQKAIPQICTVYQHNSRDERTTLSKTRDTKANIGQVEPQQKIQSSMTARTTPAASLLNGMIDNILEDADVPTESSQQVSKVCQRIQLHRDSAVENLIVGHCETTDKGVKSRICQTIPNARTVDQPTSKKPQPRISFDNDIIVTSTPFKLAERQHWLNIEKISPIKTLDDKSVDVSDVSIVQPNTIKSEHDQLHSCSTTAVFSDNSIMKVTQPRFGQQLQLAEETRQGAKKRLFESDRSDQERISKPCLVDLRNYGYLNVIAPEDLVIQWIKNQRNFTCGQNLHLH